MIALIVCGMLAGQFIAPSSKLVFVQPFNLIRYVSLPLMAAGLVIRVIAVVQLGRSFSTNVSISDEKQLYKGGLYRIVRHPSYLGELLICAGVAVCYYHPVSSALAFLLPLAAFLYRISVEEKMLRQHFGEEYIRYAEQTKKLMPFLI